MRKTITNKMISKNIEQDPIRHILFCKAKKKVNNIKSQFLSKNMRTASRISNWCYGEAEEDSKRELSRHHQTENVPCV